MRSGHVGDPVFALAVTDFIQKLYPFLCVGPTSVRLTLSLSSASHDNYTENEGLY